MLHRINPVKQFIKKWSKKVGLYDLFVDVMGWYRAIVFKYEADRLIHKREENRSLNLPSNKINDHNIVLIVVDALRADRLNSYGYSVETAPFLDRVKEKAIFGQRHYTVSPWTWATVNSLLTGLYPHNHGAIIQEDLKGFNRINFPNLLPFEIPAVTEILHECGMNTRLISGVVTADMASKGLFRRDPSDQVKWEHLPMEKLNKRVQDYAFKHRSENTFIYFQPGDVHMPISLPSQYLSQEEQARSGNKPWARLFRIYDWENASEARRELQIKLRNEYYDAAIKYVDDQIRDLVNYYQRQGLYEKTIFIVTSDHGEEMWEHAELEKQILAKYEPHLLGREHGYSMFEEMIKVPLFIFGGPIREKQEISSLTSHVDIVPTILELLGGEHAIEFDGVSLTQNVPTDRSIFAEEIGYGYEQKAIIKHNWKLIRSPGYEFEILEDLSGHDELRVMKIDEANDDLVNGLRNELLEFSSQEQKKGVKTEADEKVKERLKELGYL